MVLFMLFFHIVPSNLLIFPKMFPTFADTFVDVDGFLKRYNEADLFDKLSIRRSYIYIKLEESRVIVLKQRDQKNDAK